MTRDRRPAGISSLASAWLASSTRLWLASSTRLWLASSTIIALVLGACPRAARSAELAVPASARAATDAADYAAQVKPLLRARCFACHGALRQQADLRLDSVGHMRQGGASGAVIAEGDATGSLLMQRIASTDPAERMPPEGEGEPLTTDEIAMIGRWIGAGAPAPSDDAPEVDPVQHWAFRPLIRPTLPNAVEAHAAHNPVDRFLAEQRQLHSVNPQPEANRETLLRRLTFDLIGLPPTTAELEEFCRDPRPDWYEQAVERLLNDPRHGERWARHWMDIWRYSDWWGLGEQLRNSQKHIWHWRDWIVESLNADLPYDEMVRLMLAADELYPNDLNKLRASGYLARNYFLFNRHQWMDEVVEHVSKGFLGLTMNCAKCHDHKFDPVSQDDYYRMRAIFEPYHVRNDMIPGVGDLAVDGIPRAYDGLLDVPTFRLIRGQENQPDNTRPMAPGMPAALYGSDLAIHPVALPVEAWQPERRSWVLDAHRVLASRRAADARNRLAEVRAKATNPSSATAVTDNATPDNASAKPSANSTNTDASPPVVPQPELLQAELRLAELQVALVECECRCIDAKGEAMQATWAASDSKTAGEGRGEVDRTGVTARAAARAEREVAAAKERCAVAEAELQLLRIAPDAAPAVREEQTTKISKAREQLAQAEAQIEQAGDQYARLAGAEWTATRFLDSTVDDPSVAFPSTSTGRRTALAEWIVDRRNPLTARVAVNHLWTRHFGASLTASPFDFGMKSGAPPQAKLIDWLACEFMESGWSLKHIHRVLVTSSAYRVTSSTQGAAAQMALDPDNRLWWRRTPIRMESQVLRDAILYLTGDLDDAMGGPPVDATAQDASLRRSLYFFHSNNSRHLFLTTFDEAGVKECYRRDQSIVPQQALALLNSPLVHRAAKRIAEQLSFHGGRLPTVSAASTTLSNDQQPAPLQDDDQFARDAFQSILGVAPDAHEWEACRQALVAWRQLSGELGSLDAQLALRTQLVWALLNHSDFVTLR